MPEPSKHHHHHHPHHERLISRDLQAAREKLPDPKRWDDRPGFHPISIYDPVAQRVIEHDCGCITCNDWRRLQIRPGDHVRPAIEWREGAYSNYYDNHAPTWPINHPISWSRCSWMGRIDTATVLGLVPRTHPAHYVNGCAILIAGRQGIWCVSADDLRVVNP